MRGIRNLAITIAVAGLLLLATDPARALGLGEARVDSYLNQPLDLRVRLLEASELELDSLTVGTATPDDYQRLGLASHALALGLEFEIDRSQTPAVVRIRSQQPVTDPILQILVDARWASGRMLREYTLFLDPPTLDIAPPSRAQSAPDVVRPAEPTRSEPPARPTRPSPQPSEPAPVRARDDGERLVRSGDTLWSIAQANLPSSDISMDQMMLAIVELNPEAFRNGNVNQMLRGSRLTLPDAEQARRIDRASARATVQAQNRAFNQRLGGEVPVISDAARSTTPSEPETPSDPQPQPVATPPVATREAEPEGRLELVPAGDDASGSGLDSEGSEADRLRQQLARTEEELYAARLEAEDFQARLEDLEALVAENPEGLGIADAELAGLQETLRAARMAASEDADPAMRAEVTAQLDDYLERFESVADAETPADPESITEGPSADEDAPSEDIEAEPAAAEEPVVTRVGSEDGGWMSNPLFWPIAGLLALLIALAGVWIALQRRRRESDDTPAVRGAAAPKSAKPAPVTDPVERARAEVSERPGDLAAHLALLQALAGRGEHHAFEDALEHMFEHVEGGDEPAWREAVELASTVTPEHVLVKGSADWMAGTGDIDGEPKNEIDEESEVGDLMSRLDAEEDDESDDSDWRLDEEDDGTGEPDTPMLRDRDDDEPLVLGGRDPDHDDLDAQVESWDVDEDEPLGAGVGQHGDATAPDVPDEEAEDGWLGDELAGDAESEDATRRAGDQTESAEERPAPSSTDTADEASDDEGMLLDWTDEPDAGGDDDGKESGSDDASGGDDIFAPSDDDVDVKLDLARAYLSWNSTDSAKTLLEEVVREGNPEQKEQARKLLDDL